MNELVPCPECQRHVRKTEASCPFCGEALSLSHLPPRGLPTRRLGRAATFAFGAGVVGATALVSCSDGLGGNMAVYGAPAAGTFSMNAGSGGKTDGGTGGSPSQGGNLSQGGSAQPVYGAPAAGTGNEPTGGAAGAAGAGGAPADDNLGGASGAPASDGGGGAGGAGGAS
jgi:hypothetical protein